MNFDSKANYIQDKIVVLGDSHTRSFAYSTHINSLFIGPGRTNCFYDEESAELAKKKITANLTKISPDSVIILVLGEPDIRHYLVNVGKFNSTISNLTSDDINHTLSAVNRYTEVLNILKKQGTIDCPVIYGIVPSERKNQNFLAKIYNEKLQSFCKSEGFTYFDCWEAAYDNQTGVVRRKFQADYVHLNDLILPILFKFLLKQRLISKKTALSYESNIEWSYLYKVKVGDNETRIWGDYSIKKLRDYTYIGFNFPLTLLTNDLLLTIKKSIAIFGINFNKKILVLDSREGYVPFSLKNYDVIGVEENNIFHNKAKFINKFSSSNVNLRKKIKDYSDIELVISIYPINLRNLENKFSKIKRDVKFGIYFLLEDRFIDNFVHSHPEYQFYLSFRTYYYLQKKYKLLLATKEKLPFIFYTKLKILFILDYFSSFLKNKLHKIKKYARNFVKK